MNAASSSLPAPHLMPLMRYRDLAEAMDWLERAFGFEKQIAVSDNDGEIIYGQMTYRGSLIMMGAVRETDLDRLMRQPDEVGGVETQSCYVVVDDADEHYARAVDEGADIVLDLKSDGLGRRGYSCRDPQGHIWNFGTYNPGKGLQPSAVVDDVEDDAEEAAVLAATPVRRSRAPMMAMAALLLTLGASAWLFSDTIKADLAQHLAQEQAAEAEAAYAELAKVRAEKRAADALAAQLRADLQAEQTQRQSAANEAARSEIEEARKELASLRAERQKAEDEARALREQLKRREAALDAAHEAKRINEEKLAVKTAEEARLREVAENAAAAEAERRSAQARSVAARPTETAMKTAEAPPPGSTKLETSATTLVIPPADKPESSKPVTAARSDDDDDGHDVKRVARKTAKRAKAKRTSPQEALPPTYVVNLHSVPWPYSTWYK